MGIRDWFKAPTPPTVSEAVAQAHKAWQETQAAFLAKVKSGRGVGDADINASSQALMRPLQGTVRCDGCDAPFPMPRHTVKDGFDLTVTCPHCGEAREYKLI